MAQFLRVVSIILLLVTSYVSAESRVIILLGAPASGKGTQAAYITKKLHIPHISTGELLRENVKKGTVLGQEAKSYMDKVLLVPDELVLEMLFARIAEKDAAEGYLLDGFPRTVNQAKMYEAHVDGAVKIVVINIDVPDSLITERILARAKIEKRLDDTPSIVAERLRVYHAETAPLIDYFGRQGILYIVDGQRGVDEVRAEIMAILKNSHMSS